LFKRPEEDHQLHHCCWTGRVGEREEEVQTNDVFCTGKENLKFRGKYFDLRRSCSILRIHVYLIY